jgi:hypothetical protein
VNENDTPVLEDHAQIGATTFLEERGYVSGVQLIDYALEEV